MKKIGLDQENFSKLLFNHRRRAEPWPNIVDPRTEDWKIAKGVIPEGEGKGFSFSS